MYTQKQIDFNRIEKAIDYLTSNFRKQPNLDEVAEHVHLSPYHFHRMFSEWAGVSPKSFLQFLTTSHTKKLLKESQLTLFDASHEVGLSGTSRLHDHFIKIEGMTPAEFKNGGKNLSINYAFSNSIFGEIIIASTSKGICHIAFCEDKNESFNELFIQFPNANFSQQSDFIQQKALTIFSHDWNKINEVKLHLKGTDFQLKVWESLIKIPSGSLASYGAIANYIQKPKASRAVGSAIGDNPVAFLIPCHRVIQSTGKIGEYRWGSARKTAIIGWEATDIQN
ncbi:methylated-DNA--[protein]-cysteine S-methyltransferase [Aquiflexum lacus]|uniref:methylated-DNA--[protein]-cysteine S-methyltransferase n=1 Tax=Aquiflexum lacus TaxID=2483805 RepID=UPI0018953012|nr:methylated-DNA--[protein]-cysteine S-methyltransferase [Aquiflexum lacus]